MTPPDFLKSSPVSCQADACRRRDGGPNLGARFDPLVGRMLCPWCWVDVKAREMHIPQPALERCGGR